MLIGAHVSTAGGLEKAVARGVDTNSDAIQIFNQSPRAWRPTNYSDDDFAAYREAFEASRLEATVIHAVYLINCASKEPEVRGKSIAALTNALRVGDGIGADGVVLHAGSRKGEPHDASMKRAAEAISEALAETESCRLLLENTAGTNGPLGRNFAELAELIELAGGGERLGICVDCCHLFASGYEIRSFEAMDAVVAELDSEVGLDRLGCLHVNDSAIPLGGQRDKHADVAEGEIGPDGIAAFLSEPRFEDLPALLETPGLDAGAGGAAQVAEARRLRERGSAAR
ncbi:deoxyribonuclease IV [Thermoleophilia bacterium SCSIO 60948]|nr:deoxyribonuclease IV [Thermoleophilia bacterium SCSIO 60948]